MPQHKLRVFFKRDLDFNDIDWKIKNVRDGFQELVKSPEITNLCIFKNSTVKKDYFF